MMRSPAFPPRRPSHLLRYIFPALILLSIFYYLSSGSDKSPAPITAAPPGHDVPLLKNPNVDDESVIRHPPPPLPLVEQVNGDSKLRGGKVGAPDKGQSLSEKPISGDSDSKDRLEEIQTAKTTDVPPEKQDDTQSIPTTSTKKPSFETVGEHPIDKLIWKAEQEFQAVLAKETTTLAEAAEAYRNRRGRHPPPGFDRWFQFAQENDAVIVEDFFDRIYHDLNPFWGLDPRVIRKEAYDFEMTINIRNHNASAGSDWFWTQIWLKMFKTIEHLLPDMDVALNAMDEPRLVVPWEELTVYMKKAEGTRKMAPVAEVISTSQKLPALVEKSDKDDKDGKSARSVKNDKNLQGPPTRDKHWEGTSKAIILFLLNTNNRDRS